jgi:uncharacterized protein YdaU (DUF1376 family)
VTFLNQYWRTEGKLSGTDAYLARIAGVSLQKWKALRPVLERFFTVDANGNWRHERLDAELRNANANRLQKQKAAHARWNGKGNAGAMQVHGETNACAYPDASGEPMHMQCPSPSPSSSPISTQDLGGLRGLTGAVLKKGGSE